MAPWAMTKLPRTLTVPEGLLPPALDVPDLVTAIREYGRPVEHPLLVQQSTLTIGSSPSCDVPIASEYLSSLHCVLERRGHRLRVHDQSTRNGTFYRGRREPAFEVAPGDTFMAATTQLLAVNDQMRLTRPVIAQLLGYSAHAEVDDVLVASMDDRPLLIVGPKGAGQLRLVAAIHETSLRRRGALIEISAVPESRDEQKRLIASARRGTIVLSATGSPVDDVFLDMVQSGDHHVRLVALAPSLEVAARSMKLDTMTRMQKVEVQSLRTRRPELAMLVDHLLVENRLSLRMTDLTDENQAALQQYGWPENLDEMRETVTWIAGIVREGSIRKAAPVLKVPRSTLQYWLERLRLQLPLTRNGSPIDRDRGRPGAD
jgi:transcriptional regulator of acetoin/glycerol metabolism